MCNVVLSNDMWHTDTDGLIRELNAFADEFGINTWTLDMIWYFLELKFHLIRGYISMDHIETVCVVLSEIAEER